LRTLAAKGAAQIQTWIEKKNLHPSRLKHHVLGKITLLRRINASLYKFSVRNGLRLRHIAQEPFSSYKGIRVETCHGNQRFRRYAMDQAYLEELRDSHLPWERWFYKLWLYSSDCGRSLTLWAFWSLLLAVTFGNIYWELGLLHKLGLLSQPFHASQLADTASGAGLPGFWALQYYSIVTFTTLGFGDIVPKTGLAAFFVTIEVILGYVTLGGLISIFANKLARRSG